MNRKQRWRPMKRLPKTASALPLTIRSSRSGYSSGLYSRSASWTTMTSPVASAIPRRTAAPLPRFRSCRMQLEAAARAASRSRISRLPSVEASSTAIELDAQRHRQHAIDHLVDGRLLVVDGHHDGQQRVREGAARRGGPRRTAAPRSTRVPVALRMIAAPARGPSRRSPCRPAWRSRKPSAAPDLSAEATSRGGSPGRRGPITAGTLTARDLLDGGDDLAHRVAASPCPG